MNKSEILSRFGISVKEADITPLGKGNINDTFKVSARPAYDHDFVLQRINTDVFKDVEILQNNIKAVTGHIRSKLEASGVKDIDRKVLRLVPEVESGSGKTFICNGNEVWRVTIFIDDAVTRDSVTQENACFAGKAFGQFQSMLADIPEPLGEPIPDFHNMELRLHQFRQAVSENRAGRKDSVMELIERLSEREYHACLAERLFREGKLQKRICHCDTKIDNMLFDKEGNFLCVIDLDTVMPSFVFSDFGDFLRSAANKGKEDDPNLDRVEFDMDIFKAFTEGYLESAGNFLTDVEVDNLPYAAERFSYMQAVRFLTDYLNGDTYYKTSYPEHNLVRARAQFKLLQSIESNMGEMRTIVASLSAG